MLGWWEAYTLIAVLLVVPPGLWVVAWALSSTQKKPIEAPRVIVPLTLPVHMRCLDCPVYREQREHAHEEMTRSR